MFPKKIMIIGLGLMGGSLAAACRKKFPKSEIVGVSRDKASLQFAKRKKWIHEGSSELSKLIADVDLVILCTPINVIPAMLKKIDKAISSPVVVTDVGSVKGSIQKQVDSLKLKKVQFVGAHPMVGSHEKGLRSADPFLYNKGVTFLIKEGGTNKAFTVAKKFWSQISKKTIVISSNEHDQIVAKISHLPHLIAACLIQSLSPSLINQASSGFKDTTRIAAGHESIWVPIFLENKKAVSLALQGFQKELATFQMLLDSKKAPQLQKYLHDSRKLRQKI